MERLAATFREYVIRPGDLSSVASDICGAGTDVNRWAINPGSFLALWDDTGELLDFNRRVYEADLRRQDFHTSQHGHI